MLKVLYLYNSTQTYTNTVFEHISCFGKYSKHHTFYCHQDPYTEFDVDLSRFDAVAIHYSIRLPYDQVSPSTVEALKEYGGLKFLFIQDEYDFTHRAWYWIKLLGIQLVFTVVPEAGVEKIYPASEFPNTRFISILTGYVPEEKNFAQDLKAPSKRQIIVGYRGRPLPVRYGQLGIEKVSIGRIFKTYCDDNCIRSDIAWTEESRIYGPLWHDFMASCRAMLGSESGSNVFDWDGTLVDSIAKFRDKNRAVSDDEVYRIFVQRKELCGIMNQVSPRIFEAIAAKTVLVLFEGDYSGVVSEGEHFISVKKDSSNLAEVLRLLHDATYVDNMAERAYEDIINSGKYSYKAFSRSVDAEINLTHRQLNIPTSKFAFDFSLLAPLTLAPIRAQPPQLSSNIPHQTSAGFNGSEDKLRNVSIFDRWRNSALDGQILKPLLKRLIRRE